MENVMEYVAYKLKFTTGVHFGNGTLDDTEYTFYADTLFSALCLEAIKHSQELLDELLDYAKSGQVLFSDAMPYMDGVYYIPKPMCEINHSDTDVGNSSKKKLYKKTSYIPYDYVEDYINGELPEDVIREFNSFGEKNIKVSAAINNNEETVPYRVGEYYYNQDNGLYIIVRYNNEKIRNGIEKLLLSLSYSGIGGERSSGLGRFSIETADDADELFDMIEEQSDTYMTLSVSLPKDDEIEQSLENAGYNVIKRSGFIDSWKCTDRRKNDMYLIAAGACVKNKYEGDIYNVARGEVHPVYRYAKPMFMGVKI